MTGSEYALIQNDTKSETQNFAHSTRATAAVLQLTK